MLHSLLRSPQASLSLEETLRLARFNVRSPTNSISALIAAKLEAFGVNVPALERRLVAEEHA
jgi:hypothetical protein